MKHVAGIRYCEVEPRHELVWRRQVPKNPVIDDCHIIKNTPSIYPVRGMTSLRSPFTLTIDENNDSDMEVCDVRTKQRDLAAHL